MTPTQVLRALIFADRAALDALAGHCCSTHLDDDAVRACERCGLLVDAVLAALVAELVALPVHWAVPIERPGGPSVQYLEREAVLARLKEQG
jgi:hypothetical protein